MMNPEDIARDKLRCAPAPTAQDIIKHLRTENEELREKHCAELRATKQAAIAVGEDLRRRVAEIMQGKIDLLNEQNAEQARRIAELEAALEEAREMAPLCNCSKGKPERIDGATVKRSWCSRCLIDAALSGREG